MLVETKITSDAEIRDVLTSAKTIAIVGASANPHRPSYEVMQFLQNHGYRVIPVNPSLAGQTLLGETVYASLKKIPDHIDLVDIFRNSSQAGLYVDEAIEIGAKAAWMQLNVYDEDAAKRGKDSGITVIMNRCPKIEIPRLEIAANRNG